MKLAVASVYCKNDLNSKWLELQAGFLEKTTIDFKHFVFLNDTDEKLFSKLTVIGTRKTNKSVDFLEMSKNHAFGLQKILAYFRKNPNFDYYLILDSDCFPFKDKWFEILCKQMAGFPAAAIVRYENLTLRPHPSAFLFKNSVLNAKWLDFTVGESINLTGKEVIDVGCKIPANKCYPLIRTNYYNPHPLFCGIYNQMFYHHGCGSRKPHFRAHDYYGSSINPNHLMDCLFKDPQGYINRLSGKITLNL